MSHREHGAGKGAVLAILILSLYTACARRTPPDALLRQARDQLRFGNLQQAEALADQGYRDWLSRPDTVHHWAFRIAKADVLLARGQGKQALPLLQESPPDRPEFLQVSIRRRISLAQARFFVAEYKESKRLLDEAVRLASDNRLSLLVAEAELRRGPALTRLNDWAGAERSLRNAFEIAGREGDRYIETAALGNFGFNLMNAFRYDEAVPWLERARDLSEKANLHRFRAAILGNLGHCYNGLGEQEKATKLLKEAESLAASSGDSYRRQLWLGSLGYAYLRSGQPAAADANFKKALAIARQLGEGYSIAHWLNDLTIVALESGDLARAEKYNTEALAVSRKLREHGVLIFAMLRRALIALARNDLATAEKGFRETIASATGPDEADAVASAHSGLGSVYVRRQQPEKADAEFLAALKVIEGATAKLARDEWKLSFHSAVIQLYENYIDFLMSRGRPERALEVAESCRARLLAEKFGREPGTLASTTAARLRETAASLQGVLLSYWIAPDRSFAWVTTARKIESFVLPPRREIEPLVETYKQAILNLRDPLSEENVAGRRLYDIVIAPAAKLAPPGSRIMLVPDGCLHELNFETLPAPGARPHYWLEDVTISVTPSLSVLSRDRAARRKPGPILVVGDPVPPGSDFPRLPDAARELESIRKEFAGSEIAAFTGAAAHPGAYREANPGRFALIHFSAHATANRESPLDSAVILSRRGDEYKLYARDVMRTRLTANLVTISACRGAGARLYAGEGLVGLTWAFLEAGARNVIAGLWDVDDRSTSSLISGLYAELKENRTPAAALRTAKLSLLKSQGPYRKPYYWAPFEVFTRASF